MKITRKKNKIEAMLNDMFATQTVERFYKEFDFKPFDKKDDEYMSLCVRVNKDDGYPLCCDMNRYGNFEEALEDDKLNRNLFVNATNAYYVFILAQRLEPIQGQPYFVIIQSEAVEY